MLVIEGDDSLCSRVWCGVVDVVLMVHLTLSCVVEWVSYHGQKYLVWSHCTRIKWFVVCRTCTSIWCGHKFGVVVESVFKSV